MDTRLQCPGAALARYPLPKSIIFKNLPPPQRLDGIALELFPGRGSARRLRAISFLRSGSHPFLGRPVLSRLAVPLPLQSVALYPRYWDARHLVPLLVQYRDRLPRVQI